MSDVAREFPGIGDIEARALSLARQLDFAVACLRLAHQIAREGYILALPVRRQFNWEQPVGRA